mmetsp:Transcript_15563/g.27641  ORF Transcript_15563/g.27641 Transcript_15563/m.27641 type:complete len:347 (+) Transcript_15563:80-1120(+)
MRDATGIVRVPVLNWFVDLKYLSLLLLVLQNVGLIMGIKYSRVNPVESGEPYIASTAVVMSELIKFIASFAIEWMYFTPVGSNFWDKVKLEMLNKEMLALSVPGILYCIQNNLLFVSVSNLSVAMYQVSAQLKILTTAVLSVLVLGKRLSSMQVIALFALTAGVAIVQLSTLGGDDSASKTDGNQVIGMMAVFSACMTSGFAAVYFEKILKAKTERSISIYIRNMQLAFFGIVIGLFNVAASDMSEVSEKGFFVGYGTPIWSVIMTQAVGGLLVAVVIKYADNILKGFATSVSIVVASLLSSILFNAPLTQLFLVGASLVLSAVYLYGKYPAAPKTFQPVPQKEPV